jgi:L-lactate dehydrogenase
VGIGYVGASVAVSLLQAGVAREILLNDLNEALAEGEAMDLAHGAPLVRAVGVRTASVAEMVESADVIVISAGKGGSAPNESRLALLRDNAGVARIIGEALRGFEGVVVVVSNPVDVLTQYVAEVSGLPPRRVIGTGTMLDTARLRHAVGRELTVDAKSVHALVVGEHGDSEVVLWSGARVGGRSLRRRSGWGAEIERRLAEEVRVAAYDIIRRKGATNHAIGLVAANLTECILRDEHRVLTVSRRQEGLGLGGVALSLPAVVGAGGAETVIEPEMTDDERGALARSSDVIADARRSIG